MGKSSKQTTTTTALQPFLGAYQDLLREMQGTAGSVQFNPQQLAAFGMYGDIAGGTGSGAADPYIDAASKYFQQAGTPFSQEGLAPYLDPYTQNVVNTTQNQFNEQNGQQQNALVGNLVSSGAFGGDRSAVLQAQLAGQQQTAQAPVIAGLENQGYQTALDQYNADMNRYLQLGAGEAGLGSELQGLRLSGAGALQQSGQEQAMFPLQIEQWLAQMETGLGGAAGSTSTTKTSTPFLSQLMGGLMSGAGIIGGTGGFGPSGWLSDLFGGGGSAGGGLAEAAMFALRRGGGIRGYADGGDTNPALAMAGEDQPSAPPSFSLDYKPMALDSTFDEDEKRLPWLALLQAGLSTLSSGNVGTGAAEGLKLYTDTHHQNVQERRQLAALQNTQQFQKANLEREVFDMNQRIKQAQDQFSAEKQWHSADDIRADKQLAQTIAHENAELGLEKARLGIEAGGTWQYAGVDPITQKPILINSRTGHTMTADAPIGAKPVAGIAPVSLPENTGSLQGDTLLKSLPADTAAVVKGMINGTIAPPTSFALTKPYWQQMIQLATRADPNFDETTWPGRVKTHNSFVAGQDANNITAINTALQHAGVVAKSFEALHNGDIPAFNAIGNWVSEHTGNPAPTNAKEAVDALASEGRKVFAASGGGNLTELENWQKNFPINGSPAQQKGALSQFVQLLDSRLNALQDKYAQGMGRTKNKMDFLTPHSKEVYDAFTGAPASGPKVGDVRKGRTGNYRFKGGDWHDKSSWEKVQ